MQPARSKRWLRSADRPSRSTDRSLRMDPAEALVGRLLCGKWRVDGLLSSGGTSRVYSGTHRNGRRVAIKVLRPELGVDARTKRRFLREGYLANRVGHPGAVCILDDDDDDGIVFLVMEILEGTNLERLSREGTREPGEVAFIVDGLLDILVAAHDRGIVHRDIKPSNVFLTTKGEIKLIDFGIARLREPSSAFGHTCNGAVLGTPGFMAPEQARARWGAVDARTDIWAVGATMFRLLTGRPVHEGVSGQEAVIAAATLPVPPLATVRADVPCPLAELVDRALRFEAGARWQSALEMRLALRAIRSELPPYECDGARLTGGTSGERTFDPAHDTPTTSFVEESRPAPPRSGARRRPASRWILPVVVAAAAGAPLVAVLRVPTDAAMRQTAADLRPTSAAPGDAVASAKEVDREATSSGPTEARAIAEPPPSATSTAVVKTRSADPPGPAPPRSTAHPRARGASPAPPPAATDPVRATAPPALEEFLDERR
jgi:serine/threonine-protein kinase